MKNLTVALSAVAASVFLATSSNAAEIYNKDANKVDLYGKAVGLRYFSSHKDQNGDQTYARLGFRGETQINNYITGFGQWEYNFQGNNPEGDGAQTGNKTRLAYAGLKLADAGSLDYGRNYGVVYDALSYTDVFPEFGPTAAQDDNFFVGRVGGVATYRNTDFFGLVDGLSFAIQYLGKNERKDKPDTSNGEGVGGSVSYEYEGFGFVAAYGAADRTKNQKKAELGKGKKAEQWATGVKYDANNLYLAASYGETNNTRAISYGDNISGVANKTEDFTVVAQYQFDFGLRPSLAYTHSKAKNLSSSTDISKKHDDGYIEKFVEVGASYYFNKNMSTYIDYKINMLDKNKFTERTGVSTDDIVAVGLVYQF